MRKLRKREQEVLDCLCLAMETEEICKHLGLAEGTVKCHISRLFRLFAVHSRLELVVHAYRNGLVKIDGGR